LNTSLQQASRKLIFGLENPNRALKNVFEAADARQKQAKKRSLCTINEHFELVFNTAAAMQIVFQRPVKPFRYIT
jgi:hypothetical protein